MRSTISSTFHCWTDIFLNKYFTKTGTNTQEWQKNVL